jgi:hypothetical protein
MAKKEYPYQNLSLDDLEGEEWEDIPGLDGYFWISNFGRIKRQPYEMQYRNGAIYLKPEKIIKPQIVRLPNKFKKDYTYFLAGRVILSGRKYNITIARMVYHCFVEPFDLEDQGIVILCKDTDNFNIHPSNLKMATKSQKQRRAVARKRFKSPLLDMSEQDRSRQREAILKTVRKQVSQYSMKGRKIKTYPSAAEAQRATGVFATSIGKVASGEDISAGGFIWRWGKEPQVDVVALKQEKRNAYVKKYGQKVTQYDLSGKKIAHYPSTKDAAEASGAHINAINKVLKGEYKSAKGFFWKKGYGKDFIDLSNYKWGRQSMALTQSKPVKQYSLDGKYIQTFGSVKLAAQNMGLTPSSIIDALKGRQHTCGGFKWKYANNQSALKKGSL